MQNVSDFVSYWARLQPQKNALTSGGKRLDWAGLAAQTGAVARALRLLGVTKGDRVAVLLENSIEWCVAYLGILRAGAVMVPLNPRYGSFELRAIEEDAECAVLISTESLGTELADRFDGLADEIILAPRRGSGGSAIPLASALTAGGEECPAGRGRQDLAAICYTSGTTGLPKGAMYTHGGIIDNVFAQMLAKKLTSDERTLIVAPLAFTGAFVCILTLMILIGGSAVIVRQFDPDEVLRLIEEEGITHMIGVPAIWERIARHPDFDRADFSSMRLGVTGGAPVPSNLIKQFMDQGLVIRQTYGCTEGGGMNAITSEWAAVERPHTCGEALISADLMIAGPDGARLPAGEIGEIWLRGPQVMAGYWRQPETTSEAFSADGWYKTGDLAMLDDRGQLVVMDRKKNMIISGGVNIYPAEIERAMATIEGLIDVAVFGIVDDAWGESAVAIVHLAPGITGDAVLAECRRLLGTVKSPKRIIVSPDPLPRTVTNKVARGHLPELYRSLEQAEIVALAASVR